MFLTFDTGKIEDYRTFLKVKSLPRYRLTRCGAEVPDEYAGLLGITPPSSSRDVPYVPAEYLFDYQRDIAALAIRKRKFAGFLECGYGKTAILLEFGRHAAQVLPAGKCVLIVSPLMVVRQTLQEARRFYGDSLPIEQVRARDLASWLRSGTSRIGITNYEAITDDLTPGRLGGMVCDECFIGSTLVDTPSGPQPIKDIRAGDAVLNATGADRVVAAKRRMLTEVARVRFTDGREVICSTNHPFFTSDGVIGASDLTGGTYVHSSAEAMRVLRGGAATPEEHVLRKILLSELAESASGPEGASVQALRVVRDGSCSAGAWSQQAILQPSMLGVVAYAATGGAGKSACSRGPLQAGAGTQRVARCRISEGNPADRACPGSQSDISPRGAGQDFGQTPRDRTCSQSSRRQRSAASCHGDDAVGSSRAVLACGVCGVAGQETARIPDQLQTRPGLPRGEDRGGDRRVQPHRGSTEGAGPEEGSQAGGAWVASVEVYQSGSPEFRAISGGADHVELFDLQVERHPSFSVLGLLVHNSSLLKSAYGAWGTRLVEMGKGLEWKLCLTGTPAPNDRIEFANHAVFLDQFPTVNSFLSRYFVNRGETSNRWELRPHALKPFYRSLSHWCIFLQNPATYGWKDNTDTIPPIEVHIHDIPLTPEQARLAGKISGDLFGTPTGIGSRAKLGQLAKGKMGGKDVPTNKPAYIRSLVDGWIREESTLIWCQFNDEQALMERTFPEAVSIDGSTPEEERQRAIEKFQRDESPVLISKAKVLGFGLNLQIATRQVFSGLADSWEMFHQAVKRSNRYGSTRPLNVHIPITPLERPMIETVLAKAKRIESDTAEQERLFKDLQINFKGGE